MAIVACGRGHYYDNEKYGECPFCADPFTAEAEERTQGFFDNGSEDITVGFESLPSANDDRTVGYFEKYTGMDPPVGWLVCKSGPERGRDWRLHAGRNNIGRSPAMDVCVEADERMSREKHCAVIYDPRNDEFLAVPGQGTLTYIGGNVLTQAVVICTGDALSVGESVFVFVEYCKGERNWQ